MDNKTYTVEEFFRGPEPDSYPEYAILGPTNVEWEYISRDNAQRKCDLLNAAYAAGISAERERTKGLVEALDKAVARFDGILGNMSELSKMTPTQRMSYDATVRAYRDEARAALSTYNNPDQ